MGHHVKKIKSIIQVILGLIIILSATGRLQLIPKLPIQKLLLFLIGFILLIISPLMGNKKD
ncbi:hypothetical protein [Clostridium combesii]|uniref:Uncharacterized protein n=1 Tax=Clostridium combesii TaxID=39481 RepID=A0A2G7HFN5_9CLOT|nr:hypothetical protein [Clostridium combesii]PIH03899.1 hypothetical protein CS538_11185 [Clostridium combesii]